MSAQIKNSLRSKLISKIQQTVEFVHHQVQQSPGYSSEDSMIHSNSTLQVIQPFCLTFDVTKIAHILLFMGLGFLFIRSKAKPAQQVLFDLLIIAFITEILQLFIEGRSALWGDVLIDFSGGLIGVGAALIFFKNRRIWATE